MVVVDIHAHPGSGVFDTLSGLGVRGINLAYYEVPEPMPVMEDGKWRMARPNLLPYSRVWFIDEVEKAKEGSLDILLEYLKKVEDKKRESEGCEHATMTVFVRYHKEADERWIK